MAKYGWIFILSQQTLVGVSNSRRAIRIIARFFFYLGFLSPSFTNHITAGERGGHFFNSSLPLPPTTQATLAGRLLQGAHLCTWLATGLEPAIFGF